MAEVAPGGIPHERRCALSQQPARSIAIAHARLKRVMRFSQIVPGRGAYYGSRQIVREPQPPRDPFGLARDIREMQLQGNIAPLRLRKRV